MVKRLRFKMRRFKHHHHHHHHHGKHHHHHHRKHHHHHRILSIRRPTIFRRERRIRYFAHHNWNGRSQFHGVRKIRRIMKKRRGVFCKNLRKCNKCCQRKHRKLICRTCCRTKKYCRKNRRALVSLSRRFARRLKHLRRANIVGSKRGLKRCKVYIRCGCYGRRRPTKHNKRCCRKVNVCKKYISGSVRRYLKKKQRKSSKNTKNL